MERYSDRMLRPESEPPRRIIWVREGDRLIPLPPPRRPAQEDKG